MASAVPPIAELQAPAAWRTLDFLSDLHLDRAHPRTLSAFARYLAHTRADAVFLLGDLFEVWVGDDALHEPGSFEAEVGARLQDAAARRPLYFLHGNRDFLVGEVFARTTGVRLLADPTVLVFAGQRWLLSHGDALCLEDVEYQRFRRIARDPAWQASLLAQPLAARRAQGHSARRQSEARKSDPRAIYADVDTPAALAWLAAAGSAHLIHGHTHRPAEHVLAPGVTRHVLSDWELDSPPHRADLLRLTPTGLARIAPEAA